MHNDQLGKTRTTKRRQRAVSVRPTNPTRPAQPPTPAGSTPPITTDPTPASTAKPPQPASTTSRGTTPRGDVTSTAPAACGRRRSTWLKLREAPWQSRRGWTSPAPSTFRLAEARIGFLSQFHTIARCCGLCQVRRAQQKRLRLCPVREFNRLDSNSRRSVDQGAGISVQDVVMPPGRSSGIPRSVLPAGVSCPLGSKRWRPRHLHPYTPMKSGSSDLRV